MEPGGLVELQRFFDDLYRPARLRGKSAWTLETYRPIVAIFTRWHLATRARPPQVADLTAGILNRYLADLEAGRMDRRGPRAAATINKHRRHLVAIAREAAAQNQLADPPRVARVPEPLRSPEAWTLDQVERILAVAARWPGRVGPTPAATWWSGLVLLVYSTGLRISAAMALRPADLDLAHHRILARAAPQRQRADQWLDLLPMTADHLAAIQAPGRLSTLFGDWGYDRGTRSWPTLDRHYKKILRQAKLPATAGDLWHRLRRTFATQVAIHSNPGTAQQLLGHSGPEVTARYLAPRHLGAPHAAELLAAPRLDPLLRICADDQAAG